MQRKGILPAKHCTASTITIPQRMPCFHLATWSKFAVRGNNEPNYYLSALWPSALPSFHSSALLPFPPLAGMGSLFIPYTFATCFQPYAMPRISLAPVYTNRPAFDREQDNDNVDVCVFHTAPQLPHLPRLSFLLPHHSIPTFPRVFPTAPWPHA